MNASAFLVFGRILVVAIGTELAVFTIAITVAIHAFAARAVAVDPTVVVVTIGSSGAAWPVSVPVMVDAFAVGRQVSGASRGFRV